MTTTWKKTPHRGIHINTEGQFKVRVALKRNGQYRNLKRVLPAETPLAEVLSLRDELERQLRGGTPTAKRLTLIDYAERWIEDYAAENRPRVARVTMARLRDHILPEIGHLYVDELTREHVISMTRTWSEKRKSNGELYSRETIKGWWRVTKAFVADAAAEHQIVIAPTTRVRLPRAKTLRPLQRE